MSRAFVKEDADADARIVLPDKPISTHPNYVTRAGLRLLQEARSKITDDLYLLVGDESGDAKLQKAQLERELRYLEARLKSAILAEVEGLPNSTVRFGATVLVLDEDERERQFAIVGEDEADISKGLVSWVSPLAKALHGASAGDIVVWKRPAGEMELEVVKIDYL